MTGDTNLAMKWDLESIFPGGSSSKEFKEFREKLRADLVDAKRTFDKLPKTLDLHAQIKASSLFCYSLSALYLA